MTKTPDFLKRNQLIAACPNLNLNPILHSSIDSTSDELRRLALAGAEENTLVIAQQQTNGHGRLGRTFSSPSGGLYFSLLLRPNIPLNNTLPITAAAAVAVAQALENHGAQNCQIKWVNDVLIDQRKVCGILTQSVLLGNQTSPSFVMVGVGINLLTKASDFPPDISKIARGVLDETEVFSNQIFCDVLSDFLNRFWSFYQNLSEILFYEEYCQRCISVGQSVTILKNGIACATAKALAVEQDFSLSVELEDGTIEQLRSGEISIQTNHYA